MADQPGHVDQVADGALPTLPELTAWGRPRTDHGGPVLAGERYLAGSHLGFHWLVVALFVMFVCFFVCRGLEWREGRERALYWQLNDIWQAPTWAFTGWYFVSLSCLFVCLFACRRVGRGKGGKEGRGRREGAVLAAEGQFSGSHLGLHRFVVCLFVMFVCLFVCRGEWRGKRGPCIWQASTWASIGQ